MAKDSEKKIEAKLNEWVKIRKGLSIKLLPFLMAGLPDRMCLLPKGIIFFVEIKSEGKKPSPIQLLIHKKIRELGFEVYIIDTFELLKITLSIYE